MNDVNEIKDFKNDFMKFALSDKMKIVNSYSMTPYVLEERNLNVSSFDLYSRMLYDRLIFLGTDVSSESCNLIVAQLLYLESLEQRDITLMINSSGGSVIDGLQVIDTMNYISSNVRTMCLGMAASMGAVILSNGEKGKRYCLPHSRVMIHQVSSTLRGTFSDMEIELFQAERCKKDTYNILSENTGKTYEEIERLCDRNNWFIGIEAVELGIVDELLIKK